MMIEPKPLVSIIIRTFNEESWLRPCVDAIRKQSLKAYEIVLVDSGSEDATLALAKQLGIEKITEIRNYKPGAAINMGAALAAGDFLVVLSAHCVPADETWLENLVAAMEDKVIAGAYGRQLPLAFTSPDDARDLLMTFGVEDKIQTRDPMFHNANSIIRKEIWDAHPFSDEVTNIEDRVWAQQVMSNGYNIKYVADAKVYHYHGIHQHGPKESFRAAKVNKIIQSIDNTLEDDSPGFLDHRNYLAPILVAYGKQQSVRNSSQLIDSIHQSSGQPVYVLSEENPKLGSHVHWLERNGDYDFQLSMSDMFSNALTDIEENEGRIIDALGFVDTTYINPRPDLLMSCLSSLFMLNYSSVFPAYVDNGNFWLENHTGFEEISNSLKRRDEKPKVYRACYGLGTFFKASVIRCKLALKENNGVIPFYEMEHALRDRTSE